MASKSDILNNLREYSSDQIAEAINAGIVTIYELSKTGNLTPLMRRRIEEKLAAKTSAIEHTASEVAQEIAPTLEVKTPLADTLSSDEEVVIPVASDLTASASPTFGAEVKDLVSEKETNSISNKGMFKRPFSFNGRIRRLEYGISFIIYLVWYVVLEMAEKSPNLSQGVAIILLISFVPMLWFLWAQSCKRCHDRGNSGWYQLIPFYFLVLLFGEGVETENEYGDNPKD